MRTTKSAFDGSRQTASLADALRVLRPHLHAAAVPGDLGDRCVAVGNGEDGVPVRPSVREGEVLPGQLHEAAVHALLGESGGSDEGVRAPAAGQPHVTELPAEDAAVEVLRGRGVARVQLGPAQRARLVHQLGALVRSRLPDGELSPQRVAVLRHPAPVVETRRSHPNRAARALHRLGGGVRVGDAVVDHPGRACALLGEFAEPGDDLAVLPEHPAFHVLPSPMDS